jgi:predicted DNA-binding transcriptional regulator YafY
MDAYELIAEAIRTKRQVYARYHGADRVFSPHALGTKNGKPHLLAYQFAGESRSGLPEGGEWRCLNLEEVEEITIQAGPWHSAANVFNPQTCLDVIDLTVEPFPPYGAGEATPSS